MERDIVERLKPRITKAAREIINDNIEALEAMGEGKDDALELNALQVVMAIYDTAPDAVSEITELRAEIATARDDALEEAAAMVEAQPFLSDFPYSQRPDLMARKIRARKGPKP